MAMFMPPDAAARARRLFEALRRSERGRKLQILQSSPKEAAAEVVPTSTSSHKPTEPSLQNMRHENGLNHELANGDTTTND
ncbi:MAG: hypothetical protein RIC55_05065 [Pirellulaceae bacterium]